MTEKVKAIVYGICWLVGFLLMMGAEGGIVGETLTEGTGYLLMVIGLGLIVAPMLVEKCTGEGV